MNKNHDENCVQYWLFSPGENAHRWDEQYNKGIMAMDKRVTDLRTFKNEKQIEEAFLRSSGNKHSKVAHFLWDFLNTVKIGDVVFARKGVNKIIGKGIVTSDYIYDRREDYRHIRKVKWIEIGSWDFGDEKTKLPQNTLTNITDNNPERLETIKGFFKKDSSKKEYSED